ncbi:hypothetical protein PR202_gb16782 [Eleusine coracana subsp. coracana]|uniref:Pentatricopeptide repeat-containing protein n=1 Tax=Eleusine coracana subsp. coracana TaxID=191504 RepID=A0AAV5F1P0_ELECO|nr:hypothetical protein PR202_gb16725 [Eleusine coracana subsp. coracana]GJN28634.1 hypothetical protein PR202_gb16782 [Eleusine coracana subsp. coracana]
MGQIEAAEKQLWSMEIRGMESNVVAYNCLIDALCKSHEICLREGNNVLASAKRAVISGLRSAGFKNDLRKVRALCQFEVYMIGVLEGIENMIVSNLDHKSAHPEHCRAPPAAMAPYGKLTESKARAIPCNFQVSALVSSLLQISEDIPTRCLVFDRGAFDKFTKN